MWNFLCKKINFPSLMFVLVLSLSAYYIHIFLFQMVSLFFVRKLLICSLRVEEQPSCAGGICSERSCSSQLAGELHPCRLNKTLPLCFA